ncbi:MAG: multicopper oxidase domain-containing protein [Deltaproteobacteria bacterium]|nr:multicopper oxidase domain-containing protein [Deltaproteobacteria bacterium]
MDRRDFLKWSIGGVSTLVVGSRLPWLLSGDAFALASTQTLTIEITDAIKDMVTHNAVNTAQCYFWVYKMSVDGAPIPVECPGPTIVARKGDTIAVSITNALDEPHSFVVPGMYDSGVIDPGATVEGTFTVAVSGAHLYYDDLNVPVNRVMGLHGALLVLPDVASGAKFTPYDADRVTPGVQKLYNDFGGSAHFPGLPWEQGDSTPWVYDPSGATPNCTPFRSYIWVTHQASPNLFAEVGSLGAGEIYPATVFVEKLLRDPFSPTKNNNTPQYFTINGQSGFFSHFSPFITPQGRVGEPVVVHILNAGLWTHALHLHANHFYVTALNGVVAENPIWVDVYNVRPMDRVDYTIPFMRPPDLPNERGIGYPDTPLQTLNGHPVWPPVEEFGMYLPPLGTKAGNGVELGQRMSPLCYPMHDHSEPSQTAQGGNYNCGLISGMYFTGDRNTPGHLDFPMDHDFQMMNRNVRGVRTTVQAPGVEPMPMP